MLLHRLLPRHAVSALLEDRRLSGSYGGSADAVLPQRRSQVGGVEGSSWI